MPKFVLGFAVALLISAANLSHAQFDALTTINVTGSGNVATETDYVPNVVKCENGLASFEALKAQAVAARTFAYYKMDLQGFINDGTSDQVFSCAGSAGTIHQQAAQATEGEILWVRDNIGAQSDVLIASFYVAGSIPNANQTFDIDDPGIIVGRGDPDPTNTERFVTYTYANDLTGGFNQGSTLGFRGTPTNPNWPNRGAKSQNGADFLSDNSVSYLDILKYYYGADIQLRTAETAGTNVTYGTKTLVNFDDYTGSTDGNIDGHEGTFHRSPTFSGSTTPNVAGSTAERSNAEARSGSHSQLLDITYDESSGTDFLVRHISGARYGFQDGGSNTAARIDNLQFESIGSIGFWLKTDDPGLEVSIALDDPETGDRGVLQSVIADNQWHKYEWFLDEPSEWEAWIGAGNGQIDGTNVSIDSIQLVGSSDAQVYLDDIFWDPQAVFVPPIPGDFDGNGFVDGADLDAWQTGYGITAAASIADGDADGDGNVDGADYLVWQRNFGPAANVSASAVPEPATAAMFTIGCLSLAVTVRRTRRSSPHKPIWTTNSVRIMEK
ncbi:MAG: SpoIID/LytB domain-containing protein [Planctomycetota bacterium]